jgi:hypothetical protein
VAQHPNPDDPFHDVERRLDLVARIINARQACADGDYTYSQELLEALEDDLGDTLNLNQKMAA